MASELPDPGIEFEVINVGVADGVDVAPKRDNAGESQLPFKLPLVAVPAGLPPVLPSRTEQLEEFLKHPEKLPIHDFKRHQQFFGREKNPSALYHVDVSPLSTRLAVDRNPTTGELLGIREECMENTGITAKNSTSLRRPPGPPAEGLRGSSKNFPFWPGGLEDPNLEALKKETESTEIIDLEKDLLTTAPGLPWGMEFESKKLDSTFKFEQNAGVLSITDLLSQADEIQFSAGSESEEETVDTKEQIQEQNAVPAVGAKENLDEIIKLDSLDTEGEEPKITSKKPSEEWAIKVDIKTPVDDFHKRIPDMAHKWPFEPDVFQKQAILRLEKHENVFVAAHTSAGKTVVAEYAIALCMQHMTRSIYTSPIKALSNQKFREFKLTFGDVGLVTGDVQIRPEAACLIMTTEILRSMLYNGSDVIRDLEWVIFDEVHYINDAERGVVWEEVLIMLPQHVNIILLSATVHNTMEFADWIGRIKRKRVYVVSTQKRPVPLEHYLYTGNSGKTSDELFLLVGSKKEFLTSGYNKAVNAKKERASKSSQSFGAKGTRGGNPQQDKNVWLSIIEMLRKKDKLPILAFTFSKKRIEDNAGHLRSIDLTTASEKHQIHSFFQQSIGRLKGSDKELPQVKQMQELLGRGIGIHHSGILPILKEVVEMCFQRSLVKVLLATETFAMGVNMPARTVVFDTIRKHDGINFRDLLPGEYIQMAGRAGRRGLDSTGTVIILCKGDVPEMADLHRMMLGKPPALESKFRITYSMILNLLRVEQLRVEDMMKRSFSEFSNQKDMAKHESSLKSLTETIRALPELVDYSGDLEEYYKTCDQYCTLRMELMTKVLTHPQAVKALMAGRVVVVDNAKHTNLPALILQTTGSKEKTFTVLTLCEQYNDSTATTTDSSNDLNELPKPYGAMTLYRPEGACGHTVIDIKSSDISVLTTKTLKISTDKIINDWKKRQIPRFKEDPPGQSVTMATQELLRLVESNPNGLTAMDPVKDFGLRDIDLVEQFRTLSFLEKSFSNFICCRATNFEENFREMRHRMKLQDQYNHLRFCMSEESLLLLPEYQQRVEVLKELKYIDNTVQLKGRVACEISNHELLITELVFENTLTVLHPTEIAAVLSSVVFEQKRCSEPNLCPDLVTAKEAFTAVARRIGETQKQCGLLMPVDDYIEQFHFGLMEVVFEWARGMPFKDITALTDVQEGIIVRCIQRLDEVLRDVRNAARIIGDPTLQQKMEEASRMIKRDIVFAASLYTQ